MNARGRKPPAPGSPGWHPIAEWRAVIEAFARAAASTRPRGPASAIGWRDRVKLRRMDAAAHKLRR